LPHPGLLPRWLLFTSFLGLFNTVQNFVTLTLTQRVYANCPHQVTPLQSRTFAVWTVTSGMVRAYCAYNITDPVIYQMALWTYAFVLIHYGLELLVYRSVKLNAGFLSPLIVGGTSFVWMLLQHNFYTKEFV